MANLTNEQIAVMTSPLAMEIITNEAYETLANKFETTVETVKQAVEAGNANATKMFVELIKTGINEAAKLV
jgi:hypothetical protein